MFAIHPSRSILYLLYFFWFAAAIQPLGHAAQDAPAPWPTPFFVDATGAAGLDFVHFSGMSGRFHLPEITGQGGALLDFDGDGDLDIYLVQGALLGPAADRGTAWFPYRGEGRPQDVLYRNDPVQTPAGTTMPRFTNVTRASGIVARGYGMGVASGDIDNDGFPDLYLTNLGPNQLWRNNGDGTFRDISRESGTGDGGWGTSAAFFDYDRDGLLDLYVANYVFFSADKDPKCYAPSSARDYCGPDAYKPAGDRLFHNRGDGSFEDVSALLKDLREPAAGLGVVASDFNNDGWPDLYVANDGDPNQLWINQKGKSFIEEAMFSGAAVNRLGAAEASMGVTAGDFDGDGDEDLFMTHLMGETNTLYVNDGKAIFDDRGHASGLAVPSRRFTAFGTQWVDLDNDGLLDLVVLNGAVKIDARAASMGDRFPLKQPNQLFRNLGGGKFTEVSSLAGKDFTGWAVSRGLALGDVDNNGATDLLILNNNGPARLLLNQIGRENHWLGIRCIGNGGRDMLGTRVRVVSASGTTVQRTIRTDGSYCSARDPRIVVGLGSSTRVTRVELTWPDGQKDIRKVAGIDRHVTLEREPLD